ncbi:MAG: choice-of-anchor B family protein [Fimbriimonadales bacterium]|nr:choice-of-anchor B family protein [Fimbriimonadales bacterium]
MNRVFRLTGTIGVSLLFAIAAFAQFPKNKVELYSHLDLAQLGVDSGNDCWGYTSPSGREYALMGCNDRVVFVEITNPIAPVIIDYIPHPSSTWGDIKVYQHYAYIVSEATGTGIQVVDMSQIDDHVITLVRTIPSPSRSHNIAIDTRSGFLYTCGSRNGTGTTMCFDLSDPANPVQVGPPSMTEFYQHDIMPYTYTSGPYAGRQILFGASEGRGVEIHDVTDKNNPFLIKRVTYPNLQYCHQVWMSEDERYIYVNDELDENQYGFTTRTRVIDVSSLENAHYVTWFTTGLPAIDHNLYWHHGFVFQANYRSGLRIFDTNDDPINPVETGFFDTYPENNNRGFQGAWSNYPYFPSGTVIVSDINRGLFILDVREAVTRRPAPNAFSIQTGGWVSGGLPELKSDDGEYLRVQAAPPIALGAPSIRMTIDGKSHSTTPKTLKFGIKLGVTNTGVSIKVEMFNYKTSTWTLIDSRGLLQQQQTFEVSVGGDLSEFVHPTSKAVRTRINLIEDGTGISLGWMANIDRVWWTITP